MIVRWNDPPVIPHYLRPQPLPKQAITVRATVYIDFAHQLHKTNGYREPVVHECLDAAFITGLLSAELHNRSDTGQPARAAQQE